MNRKGRGMASLTSQGGLSLEEYSFRMEEAIGKHPYAELLLRNLLEVYA